MVVLDSNNYGMLSNSTNENLYIVPDPNTLPPTLDAKNSPLALLAQTCSQIGADSSNAKPLLSSLDRAKKSSSACSYTSSNSDRSSSANNQQPASHWKTQQTTVPETKSPESKLAFKPYEQNVLTRKTDPTRPPSGHAVDADAADRKSNSSRASSRKSASASPQNVSHDKSLASPNIGAAAATDSSKPQTPVEASTPTPSKTSASAEPLHVAGMKDSAGSFKPPFSLSPLSGYGCNGCPTLHGFDPNNPAFRNALAGGSATAAAAAFHTPPLPQLLDFQSAGANPYLYARVKTPTGSEAVVPNFCKDPYCFGGCSRFSLHGVGPCPPGCVQCDPKWAAAAMMMSAPLASYQHYGRPYVCNWIAGEQYCGKRFRNAEELLQHLRTHASTTDPVALSQLRYAPGMSPFAPANAAARYHPYSKAALPASLAAASPFSPFNPALSPYYPPYSSLYDQRIGAAVNP